jgi:hypothetical protein
LFRTKGSPAMTTTYDVLVTYSNEDTSALRNLESEEQALDSARRLAKEPIVVEVRVERTRRDEIFTFTR